MHEMLPTPAYDNSKSVQSTWCAQSYFCSSGICLFIILFGSILCLLDERWKKRRSRVFSGLRTLAWSSRSLPCGGVQAFRGLPPLSHFMLLHLLCVLLHLMFGSYFLLFIFHFFLNLFQIEVFGFIVHWYSSVQYSTQPACKHACRAVVCRDGGTGMVCELRAGVPIYIYIYICCFLLCV